MHKPKPYKCSVCGAEVPNLPMPVLKHQLSHAKPRPYVGGPPLPGDDHELHCPFCDEVFDARDLGEVLKHYEH